MKYHEIFLLEKETVGPFNLLKNLGWENLKDFKKGMKVWCRGRSS